MQTFSEIYAGAVRKTFSVPGRYFVLLGSTNAVNVEFYFQGSKLSLGTINGLLAGLEVGPLPLMREGVPFAFDRVDVIATAADTISFGIGDGNVRYNRAAGSVNILGTVPVSMASWPIGLADTQAKKTVTNASTTLLAANAARRKLIIQNQDAAGNIFIRTDGGGAAVADASGVKIPPGGYWEPEIPPVASLTAIGDIASNTNVQVIEG